MSVSPNFTAVPQNVMCASRTGTPYTGINPLVNLVATTVLGATNYSWSVVDHVTGVALPGTPVTGQSVSVEIVSASGYDVTLTVTLADTTTVSIGKIGWIHASDWGLNFGDYDWRPLSTWVVDHNVGPAPFTLMFTGMYNQYPYPQYPHVYYHWEFGDGAEAFVVDDPTISHTYTTAGIYAPFLTGTTATDPRRCWGPCGAIGAWQYESSGRNSKGSIVAT